MKFCCEICKNYELCHRQPPPPTTNPITSKSKNTSASIVGMPAATLTKNGGANTEARSSRLPSNYCNGGSGSHYNKTPPQRSSSVGSNGSSTCETLSSVSSLSPTASVLSASSPLSSLSPASSLPSPSLLMYPPPGGTAAIAGSVTDGMGIEGFQLGRGPVLGRASYGGIPGAGSAMTANLAQSFTLLHHPQLHHHPMHHFREMLYAAHLLGRGYYQPAGPLISPHVLPPVAAAPPPPSQQQQASVPLVGSKSKQIPTPLDSDPDRGQIQPPPSSSSTVESSDSDVLITGGDLATFRYPTQQHSNQQSANIVSQQQSQQQQLHQQAAAAAAAAHQGAPPYPRSMHQMHYTSAYPPNYYSPYPGEAMCYSPPYQPYFPAKVYQSAPPPPSYRRYPPYYQPGPPTGPPPPSDIYEQSPPPGGQPPPSGPPSGTQLVPAGPGAAHAQHLEHYPGPPGYYSGYSPGGGGQCYTRSPYMEYPPQCPCPMQQSCPKNVHTGPHIGSNTSSGSNSTSSSSNNNNNITAAPITTNSSSNPTVVTTATMAPAASANIVTSANNAISKSSVNPSSMSNISSNSMLNSSGTVNANSSSNQQTQLNISRGPVTKNNSITIHQQQQQLVVTDGSVGVDAGATTPHHHFLHHSHHHPHLHHHHVQACDEIELLKPMKSELKSEEIDVDSKSSQYEENVIQPPTPPLSYEKPTDRQVTQEKESEKEIALNEQTNCTVEAFDLTISATTPKILSPAPPVVGRKARIGKTMAREMVYSGAAAIHNPVRLQQTQSPMQVAQQQPAQLQHQSLSSHVQLHAPSHLNSSNKIDHTYDATVAMMLKTKIKSEQIKTEKDEDLSLVLPTSAEDKEQLNKIKVELEIIEEITKTSTSSVDADTDDDIEITSPAVDGPKQRIKILEFHKSQCKKSPPNSYKSLIKQAEPKSYLCLSRKIEKRNRFGKFNKSSRSSGLRKRHLILTDEQKKRLRVRKKKLAALEQRKQEIKEKRRIAAAAKRLEKRQTLRREKLQKSLLLNSGQSPLESAIDFVARGYFSEPETRCTSSLCPTTGRKVRKSKTAEARSKSETKKSSTSLLKTDRWLYSATSSTSTKATRNPSTSSGVDKFRAHKKIKSTKASSKRKGSKTKAFNNSTAMMQRGPSTNAATLPATSDSDQKRLTDIASDPTANNNNTSEANNNDCLKNPLATTSSESLIEATPDITPMSSNAATLSVPNSSPSDFVFLRPAIPRFVRHHGPMKRIRSRSKFGCRKRPKHKHSISIEVDETIQPTRPDVVPKWNNGWRWEGEPFQGAIFLNSDDPHVIRTCYPAMRHSEGDIIRRRDCVLLKANEDNELPYVAKVAHLWENPEDGEMMMSLLWYYRPEHTEQGRQRNDCPDEVYASRHRDHNSVACIEDKCYVLVFREYCRYRRRLRAAEEDIKDVSIVPKRPNFFNPRVVPENTNPELVMFCRRAYEFRTKRLLKMPNKHDNVTRCSN